MRLSGRKLSWVLAVLLLACASALPAEPDRVKQFHFAIDRGSPIPVVRELSLETGLVITLDTTDSETKNLGPFKGRATADEALQTLLTDTDLSYRWDKDGISIFKKVVTSPHAGGYVREMVVTGSRLRSGGEGASPMRVYDREEIDRFGVSTLSGVANYFSQQPYSFGEWAQQSGAQYIQMRGLGVDTTLVLINGRRASSSATSVSLNAFDLNSIPLTAIDRIEVMSDSASAIYGADAIGGVINIILKDGIASPEIYLHYGQADGGGTERRAATSLGTTGDRLKASLVLDYFERSALMGEDRDLWRNQDYRRFGGLDYRVTTTHAGNVYSLDGQPLPGLGSSTAAVPSGTTGGLSPASFLATAGTINLGSSYGDRSIKPPLHRLSVYGSMQYELSQTCNLSGELLAVRREVIALRERPTLTRALVPAANPFNPFAETVLVDYSFADLPPITHTDQTELLRLSGGARCKLGSRWDYEISGLHHHEGGSSTTRGGLNRERVDAAIGSTDPQTALNLFSDGPAGSAALLDSLQEPARSLGSSSSNSQLSAFIRGPLFNLPSGRVEMVAGAEWRLDAAQFSESGMPIEVNREIVSMFSEFRVPLLDQLTLKLALRGDEYGTGQTTVNPQYGLIWRPTRDWTFRAAYGTSFRPPSLFELNMPTTRFALPIADPLRGGAVSFVDIVAGGNRDLDAVAARSFTAGVTLGSRDTRMLGVHYWRVAMDNRIVVPRYTEMLSPDSALSADRVVRDTASDQDLQAGWPGRLRSIDLSLANYGDLQTSGVDLDASWRVLHRHGNLKFGLSATWVHEYLARDMNQALPLDRVGIANVQGTIPEWRVVGSLTWEFRRFGVSATTTFTPSYRDADAWSGPLDRRIGSQTLVDVQAWMDLDILEVDLLDGSKVTLGALNVFDVAPRFANAGYSLGHDVSQADLMGQFIYFRITRHF